MSANRAIAPATVRVSASGRHRSRTSGVAMAAALAATAAIIAWYVTQHRYPSADRYHVLTTTLGWVGAVLCAAAVALSARKRKALQGVGRMSTWLTAHIYIGIVAAVAILFHSDFTTGGPLTGGLLAVFYITIVSGLLGWWLSRALPPLLTAIEEDPAIVEELLVVREENYRGMLELARAGSPDFRRLVETQLAKETGSWPRMWAFYRRRSTLAHELPAFQKQQEPLLAQLKPHEHQAFRRAADYALRVNKMNAELLLQRTMRGWLTLHIAATTLMLGLAVIHIISQLWF